MNVSATPYIQSAITAMIWVFCIGCTSVTVKPIDSSLGMTHAYIQTNDKVLVSDFHAVLLDGFARHGITTTSVPSEHQPLSADDFLVTYTAFRNWDFAAYLIEAVIEIYHDNQKVGYAEYHLRGKGGWSLLKWQSTEAKMRPVIDKLLVNYK